jgi:hypothetical protein
MIYDGRNGGTVEVLDNLLVIRRKGVASFLTQGIKGEKRIPFSSITSVQFKEPGITTGYIQFGVVGGMESRGDVFNAATDENTVLFIARSTNEVRQLRDVVESRIGRPTQAVPSLAVSSVGFSEELSRLADLRDRGVLTEEEFQEEKVRLQSQRTPTVDPALSKMDTCTRPSAVVETGPVAPRIQPSKTVGKNLGKGCLIILALLVGLVILGAIIGPDEDLSNQGVGNTTTVEGTTTSSSSQAEATTTAPETIEDDSDNDRLSAAQSNAVRSAEQYLAMSGFSRKGLIEQLSSEAGNGYSVSDATAAVDSLNVDWNENAAKSARQYLDISGFSCAGLIEQLSSSAGSDYTVKQATYGARQAGAC